MARSFRTTLTLVAAATLAATAHAQTTPSVTITGRAEPAPAVGGFGDIPLARSPLQGAVYGSTLLDDAGITQVDQLTRIAPGLSDAYNSEGYWSSLSMRGFVIDNRYNYRRDGLPINAETFISLFDKDRIEVFEGTSGIQAGTSAPGGLVNFVVKRPTTTLRQATIEWREDSTLAGGIDVSQRFGVDDRFGLRVNAEATRLRPQTKAADGSEHALAIAGDWQISADSKLEAEIETSKRSQPSVPGFSLLGDRLPDADTIDPRTNLNNQPWSLPVVLAGDTASLRWQQRLDASWSFVAHAMTQRLKSDDRIAFPFGCSAEGNFDRYCSDGSFDLSDFRSEGERRRIDALDLHFEGSAATGPLQHTLTAGVLATRTRDRFGPQAYNYAGTGTIDGNTVTPPAPDPLLDVSANRDERSTEAYLRDVISFGAGWELWGGLRATRIERETVRTDGSEPTSYSRTFTTPWLAAAYAIDSATLVYASWGQGVESEVVANRGFYTNAGESLTERSRQVEAGIKYASNGFEGSINVFQIERPLARDFCNDDQSACTRALDGEQRHRGIEASASWREGAWQLQGGAMHLAATRQGSADPAANGLRPTNVPADSLRLRVAYDLGALPGLTVIGGAVYESSREVLPDNSIEIPGWWRLDLAARWRSAFAGRSQVWRLGVDNLTDHRAWRESPYQFSHVYLFPLAPRTWRASVSSSF